ncbi:MAG: hypothetical protein ABIX37_06825 [Gammaproteobacteria bacterium]
MSPPRGPLNLLVNPLANALVRPMVSPRAAIPDFTILRTARPAAISFQFRC